MQGFALALTVHLVMLGSVLFGTSVEASPADRGKKDKGKQASGHPPALSDWEIKNAQFIGFLEGFKPLKQCAGDCSLAMKYFHGFFDGGNPDRLSAICNPSHGVLIAVCFRCCGMENRTVELEATLCSKH